MILEGPDTRNHSMILENMILETSKVILETSKMILKTPLYEPRKPLLILEIYDTRRKTWMNIQLFRPNI